MAGVRVAEMLVVAIGGAFGSLLRFGIGSLMVARLGPGFPWHTFLINVTGSFAIGLLATSARASGALPPLLVTALTAGVLGGFTTFSAFSYDTLTLAGEGATASALLYTIGSVVCGLLAALAGASTARAFLHAA